jgi:hypothetical protein
MGQLLVMLIEPPIVGAVAYIVFRKILEKDVDVSDTISRRDPFG